MKQWTAWTILLLLNPLVLLAQGEHVASLRFNARVANAKRAAGTRTAKTTATALTLPFFEDFTDYSIFPNPARWADSEVYINNTMCVSPISRGVATFDALNKIGRPYDTVNRYDLVNADSLTSQPIDLSANVPADSIYLSFFYQPQGNGFSPEVQDSLMLFFHKKNGGWQNVWITPGTDLQPFQQVMIPVTDTNFLYGSFQFRFVNKASINSNDDVWNLDYIRMAANRNINDTAVRDLAFTSNPTFLLNDYTAMPYRQFLPNAAGERAANMTDTFWNHYATPATVNYGYFATETTTGTALGAASGTANVNAFSKYNCSFPVYSTTVSPPGNLSRIVYKNTFYLRSGTPNEPKDNDSIVREQIFDNYLAYDDGTAEKSYFLNLSPALPGKTAIEFRLNAPDTLRGMAIYFGQQVPTAYSKTFSATVYSKLAGVSGGTADVKIYEQDLLLPFFTDTINQFTIYRFDNPVTLPAGVFYMGTTQPASSGSDSLYIGLDANRVGGNHLYFNVLNAWQSSLVSGALMIRPLLGGPVTGTAVNDVSGTDRSLSVFPNPCESVLRISGDKPDKLQYAIRDLQGRSLKSGIYNNASGIDVAGFPPGMYFINLWQGAYHSIPQKFIKQ